MTKSRTSSKRTQYVIGIAAACALVTAAVTYGSHSTQNENTMDPVAELEIRQARQLGRSGNWTEAARILSKTLLGNNPKAKLEYALLYARGWGVKRDLERARILLLQAVQYDFPGRGRVAFELGKLYRKSRGKDCSRIAFEWFSKALKWDYVKAHAELGKSHARGIGVPIDIERALYHYKAAASFGSPASVIPLINIIARGSEIREPDPDRARNLLAEFLPLLEFEAKKGSGVSARTLGRMYSKGGLVKRNVAKALHWFSLASTYGDAAAMHDLALLNIELGRKHYKPEKIVELLTESATRGYSGAMTALGRLHLKGEFDLQPKEAVGWFRKGVVAGHAGSMEELGNLYYRGKFVKQDRKEAMRLATEGARQNHRGCKALLRKIKKKIAKKENKRAKSAKEQG